LIIRGLAASRRLATMSNEMDIVAPFNVISLQLGGASLPTDIKGRK
jgi:hypothetical protein